MKQTKLWWLGLLIAAVASGCSPLAEKKSDSKGHFENADPVEQRPYENAQVAMPEYTESRGVVVSTALVNDYDTGDLVKAILETDVDKVWYMVPSNFQGSLNNPEFATLRRVLGSDIERVSLQRVRTSGYVSVWARDWAPLGAKAASGELRLLDFNYYPERPADDSVAQILSRSTGYPRVSVPVYNEGGNFMNNESGDCLMTTRVVEANAERFVAGDIILNAQDISEYYKTFAACKTVKIFPRMPYEGTGHIDMWAKFLNDDTILVGELRDEVLQLRGLSRTDKSRMQSIQKFLNARAADLAADGYKIVRVPMPAPLFAGGETYRSYTNSLTLNGTVIIPRYVAPTPTMELNSEEYPDAEFLPAWESEVRKAYEAAGYRVRWVESDNLIAEGGAVHCTTMQIAR